MPKKHFPYLIIIITIIMVFANTINGGYVLDDRAIIVDHEHVQKGLDGIKDIFTTNYLHGVQAFNDGLYRPISPFTFALEQEISDNNPKVSHFFNVFYFIILGIFLFKAFIKVFKLPELLALGATLLFVVHPIHTEVVANIKGRDELFAFLFAIIALVQFNDYLQKKQIQHLITGGIFFALSLFSKESAFTYVVILPFVLFWLNQNLKQLHYKIVTICGAIGGIFLLIRHQVLSSMITPSDEGAFTALNNSILSTDVFSERLGTALWLQFLYISKNIIPYPLIHDYSFNQIEVVSIFSVKALLGLIVLLAGAYFAWRFLKKAPLISIGIGWYFGTLLIVSNLLFPIGATFAERFLFAPSFGIVLILAGAVYYYIPENKLKSDNMIMGVFGLIAVVFVTMSIVRNNDWKSNYTLFTADYEKLSNSARGNYNYASVMYDKAMQIRTPMERKQSLEEAIVGFNNAIAIYPTYWDAYNNLSNAYKEAGQTGNAIKALRYIIDNNPGYSKAWFNIGIAFYLEKNYKDAITSFLKYDELKGNNADALYFAGLCAGHQKNFKQAIQWLEKCLTINPNHVQALLFAGKANGMIGNLENSAYYFKRALQIEPGNQEALNNLKQTQQYIQQTQK